MYKSALAILCVIVAIASSAHANLTTPSLTGSIWSNDMFFLEPDEAYQVFIGYREIKKNGAVQNNWYQRFYQAATPQDCKNITLAILNGNHLESDLIYSIIGDKKPIFYCIKVDTDTILFSMTPKSTKTSGYKLNIAPVNK